jgi:hypothetical protein
MASGAAGTIGSDESDACTWVALSTVPFVPTTAHTIKLRMSFTNTSENGQHIAIAPNNNYSNTDSPILHLGNQYQSVYVFPGEIELETSNIYWASHADHTTIKCMGWKDNL